MHTDPDYSAASIVLETDAEGGLKGHGITFPLGKYTEVVVSAVNALAHQVLNKDLRDIVGDSRGFYRQLMSDGQLRCPLWKLLVDMDPRMLLSCIDFRYITDVMTEEEAYEEQMLMRGYPAYTMSCAWLGYSDDTLRQLCTEALESGCTRSLPTDDGCQTVLGCAQGSGVDVKAEFKPLWIEEPNSPDGILGHTTISKALAPLGIAVATGEQCHNRVIFKQLLQAKTLQFLQIDSRRLGSVNENLSVLLMAKKLEVVTSPAPRFFLSDGKLVIPQK